jgi:hypothetical protein
MEPVAIVTIIGVFITVAAIALYLIAICFILKRVFGRLEIILGAVADVSVKSAPAGEVIAAINTDLARGHSAVAAAVERLQERAAADAELYEDTEPIDRGGSVAAPLPADRGGSVAAPLPADRGGWWQR